MDLKSLQKKISELQEKTSPRFHLYTNQEKAILTKTVKLNEEVGELCNDILSILKVQRRSKLDKFEKKNFYAEFADVIITAMQLASLCNVDIDRAVRDKIEKINRKYIKDR